MQAIPTLIELMKDPSVVVRDTTAWTVGRICELLPEAAINEVYLPPLLQCLIEGLGAEPRVASNVCWVSLAGWRPPVATCNTAAIINLHMAKASSPPDCSRKTVSVYMRKRLR